MAVETIRRRDNVDKAATIMKVLEEIEEYQLVRLSLEVDNLPSITQQYELASVSPSNSFNSKVENYAEQKERDIAFVNRFTRAVNRLSKRNRKIICEKYLKDGEMYDADVCEIIGFSKRHFTRLKKEALIDLGIALNIAVYKPIKTKEPITG